MSQPSGASSSTTIIREINPDKNLLNDSLLQGVWWVGSGTSFQPNNTVPMPAGAFVTHFGKQIHFDGAKDEDAILLIVGDGPATATLAEEK